MATGHAEQLREVPIAEGDSCPIPGKVALQLNLIQMNHHARSHSHPSGFLFFTSWPEQRFIYMRRGHLTLRHSPTWHVSPALHKVCCPTRHTARASTQLTSQPGVLGGSFLSQSPGSLQILEDKAVLNLFRAHGPRK